MCWNYKGPLRTSLATDASYHDLKTSKAMRSYTIGILVHGDNHFIIRGPKPDRETALALTRHWSVIRIGGATPPSLVAWTISSSEFRENLEWAVVVEGESPMTPAVNQLLNELTARGVVVEQVRSH